MIYKYNEERPKQLVDAFHVGDLDWFWYDRKEQFKLELAAKVYLDK